jgi:hypothetical protein
MRTDQYVLLSFDVEEFDMPLEYDCLVNETEQLQTGFEGLEALCETIDPFKLKSTFFVTGKFAQTFPSTIRGLGEIHEIGSHSFYHSQFATPDLLGSKQLLESITGKTVYGFRMPRMAGVNMRDLHEAGYRYDASINPTFIPGRYNHLNTSRTPFMQEGMLRFPSSVSKLLRIPLFWLSFKNLPYSLFLNLVMNSLKKDGYVCLYFHPWEFVNLEKYKIPFYTKRYSGKVLQDRLKRLITDLAKVSNFTTMVDYITNHMSKLNET